MADSRITGAASGPAGPVDFHSESIRGSGVLLTAVSLLSSGFAWILFQDSISRGAILIVGCILLYFGLRLMLARKSFRTWFDNGRVYWEFPSSLQGIDGSCPIADIASLSCTKVGKTDTGLRVYHLLQKDGSKKEIGARCMGDVGGFLARLRAENPSIEYLEANS